MRKLTLDELRTNKGWFTILKNGKFYNCFFLKNEEEENKCEVVLCTDAFICEKYKYGVGRRVYTVVEVLADSKETGNALYRKIKASERISKKGFTYCTL